MLLHNHYIKDISRDGDGASFVDVTSD